MNLKSQLKVRIYFGRKTLRKIRFIINNVIYHVSTTYLSSEKHFDEE